MRRECIIETKETPVTLIEGITYSQTPYWFPFYRYKDLKLDLLCPFRPDHAPLPLLVWICGGAYQTMERGAHIPWLTNFARKGYVVASIEYRTANCAPFPAQLEDSKQAIRYLRAHAQVYGIDKSRVIVGGESAGAHLASMTALTAGQTQYEIGDCLEESSAVSAVIDYYGPASFLPPAATKDGSTQEQPPKSGVNP
ncbi:MAG: alpha/beta hydrolase, partial [Eubacteriales bacterium]|nr:alpha/beta hydrolase [Eubacteriales bacterium]